MRSKPCNTMMPVKNIVSFCQIVLVSLCFSGAAYAQNLAIHKSYTLSAKPNYKLSAPPDDVQALTDGLYTKATGFWTRKSTVGWQDKEYIEITIDLGKIQPVGSVSLNTVEGQNSDVYYPNGIFVFLSNDQKDYYYSGVATQGAAANATPITPFVLRQANRLARYVKICVKPNGRFFFTDEISVLAGTQAKDMQGATIAGKSVQRFVDSLNYNKIEQKSILNNVENASDKINGPFTIEKCSPWTEFPQNYQASKRLGDLNYTFLSLNETEQFGAFILTNLEPDDETFQFSLGDGIQLFRAEFVRNELLRKIPDALVPVMGEDIIKSRQSVMYLFSVKGNNTSAGIKISYKKQVATLNITSHAISIPDSHNLNVVNWAYLTYPMLRDHKNAAVKDLEAHGVNVFVVPPDVIPNINSRDFQKFEDYISILPRNAKLLLFMNYNIKQNKLGYDGLPFLSSTWKSQFKNWDQEINRTVLQGGFLQSNVYLYPYDEVKDKNDIEDFKNWAMWVKESVPNVKIYATITNNSAAGILLKYLDIAQIPIYAKLPISKLNGYTEIWGYATAPSSRSLSPYKYYRLMAWQAYKYNLTGIGFWNYAANKMITFAPTPVYSKNDDYAVIYNGPSGNIISSRRWEAFKMGLEDYQVLKLYEQYFGKGKTLSLVNTVLNNSNDVNKAEQVKQEMLQQLKS